MKRVIYSAVLAILISIVTLTGSAQSGENLLKNGGFEDEPNYDNNVDRLGDIGYSDLTGSQIPGWTVEPGHVVSVHNTIVYATIDGKFSVNMDGSGYNNHNANLYQDFDSVAGAPYQLDFDLCTWFRSWQTDLHPLPKLNISIWDMVSNAPLFELSYSPDDTFPAGRPLNSHGQVNHQTVTSIGTGHTLRLRLQQKPESGVNDNIFLVDNFSVKRTSLNPRPLASMTVIAKEGLDSRLVSELLELKEKIKTVEMEFNNSKAEIERLEKRIAELKGKGRELRALRDSFDQKVKDAELPEELQKLLHIPHIRDSVRTRNM
jgi:hypothetical protein